MKPSERIEHLYSTSRNPVAPPNDPDRYVRAIVRYLDEIHGVLDEHLQTNLGMSIDSVGTEPRSRWVEIVATSNSGKRQWVCRCCGRVSVTPDKDCPKGAYANVHGHARSAYTVNCREWEEENLR